MYRNETSSSPSDFRFFMFNRGNRVMMKRRYHFQNCLVLPFLKTRRKYISELIHRESCTEFSISDFKFSFLSSAIEIVITPVAINMHIKLAKNCFQYPIEKERVLSLWSYLKRNSLRAALCKAPIHPTTVTFKK